MGSVCYFYIDLFRVLRRFHHCTGHITTGSWKGRGNQYIQLVKVLYCKLLTNGKQLPAFPLEAGSGTEPRLQSEVGGESVTTLPPWPQWAVCKDNYKLELCPFFIIFPESNDGFGVRLYLQITIISVTSFTYLCQRKAASKWNSAKKCIIM